MFDRQNPYFRAAMRNERLEAECRESAAGFQRMADEELARGATSPDPLRHSGASETRLCSGRLLAELLAKIELEHAERHARMREKMESFL
jgi:hypothetical protein